MKLNKRNGRYESFDNRLVSRAYHTLQERGWTPAELSEALGYKNSKSFMSHISQVNTGLAPATKRMTQGLMRCLLEEMR